MEPLEEAKDAWLSEVKLAADMEREGLDRLYEAVCEARQHGATWNEIAQKAGVTRQSANGRFTGKAAKKRGWLIY